MANAGQCYHMTRIWQRGIPVVDAPLQVTNGQLVPLATANLINGSFEAYQGDELENWFQDDAGTVSFIYTNARDGQVAVGFENFAANENGLGRVIQRIEVKPFQQYRLHTCVKMDDLAANRVGATIIGSLDDPAAQRNLFTQNISLPQGDASLREIREVNSESLDWTRVGFACN